MKKQQLVWMSALAVLSVSCQESLEDYAAREARSYTEKKCPAPVGENTVIDSLVFERATHTMHYYYTLSGPADDRGTIEKANPRESLLREIRNSTAVKSYKEAGYSFSYTYRSKKNPGETLFEATFTQKDYKD